MKSENELARFGVLPSKRHSGWLEISLRCWIRVLRLFRFELTSKTGLTWSQRWRAWRSGFMSQSWVVYELDRNQPDQYVSDIRQAAHQYRINGFFNPIIGNKLVLSQLLAARGLPHPKVITIVQNGKLIEQEKPFRQGLREVLVHSLERFPSQVFRPTWCGSGQGVFFLRRKTGSLELNGRPVTLAEVCKLLSGLDRYLATEFVEQADYARSIYPGTTNTLRIMTLWDAARGEAFAAAVTHRFGTSKSGLLDSFHGGRGGISSAVNPATATIGKAVARASSTRMEWLARHPDTGERIEGVEIPGFKACLEGVLDAAGGFSYCPLIGWDVVLTEGGYSIIEANSLPAFTVTQVHTPLLADPRTREVFSRWGMAPRALPD